MTSLASPADASRFCTVVGCSRRHVSSSYCGAHYMRWRRHGDPCAGRTPDGERDTFFRDVVLPFNGEGCLRWPYSSDSTGRPQITRHGKNATLARVICEEIYGPPSRPGLHAAHNCGNGHCINPTHLRWASPEENEADKIEHGTVARGEKHYAAKLTETDVVKIRALRGVFPQRELAEMFSVGAGAIAAIHAGSTWRWL